MLRRKTACNLSCGRVFYPVAWEENMKLLEKVTSGMARKAVLAAALLGGFLALGAGTASARPRVFVGFGGPVVVGGYYPAPTPYWAPAYVGPRYRYGYYAPRHRYWEGRARRWR